MKSLLVFLLVIALIVSLFFNLTQPNHEAYLTDDQLLQKYDDSFGGYVQYEAARLRRDLRKMEKEKMRSFLLNDLLGVKDSDTERNLYEKIAKYVVNRIVNSI